MELAGANQVADSAGPMPNNVAPTEEILRNILYRILLWVGAWARSSGRVFLIPVVIVLLRASLAGVFPGFTDVLTSIPGSSLLVTVSADLIKLVLFSTALLLSIKISVILKREVYTVRDIMTPRYKEYTGESVEYNTASIFTTGYLPTSVVRSVELARMKRYGDLFSVSSYVLFFIINITMFFVDEHALTAGIEDVLVRGTTSDLIFAMIGFPILLANLINNLDPSVYPTAETALFFLQIGIPAIPLIVGYRNSISYWKYKRANSILASDEYTIFVEDICSGFAYAYALSGLPFTFVLIDSWRPPYVFDYPIPVEIAPVVILLFGLMPLGLLLVIDLITDDRVDCADALSFDEN